MFPSAQSFDAKMGEITIEEVELLTDVACLKVNRRAAGLHLTD